MADENEMKEVKELATSEQISVKEISQEREKDFLEILKLFAPGTSLRSALDDLLNAGMGALIVVDNEATNNVIEKGFKINSRFSSQRLVELAKMDGAIILSGDMTKILYANALLFPDIKVKTRETGTRHKAAERTAKQTGALVIAVSERKNKVTIYYGNLRHELKRSSEILRRAAETLQILEKQREVYNGIISNLNLLEIENLVTPSDLCDILQRFEIIKRISGIVRRYLIELGKEGIVVSIRLKELTGNLHKEEELIFRDYFSDEPSVKEILEKMSFDFLLETANIEKSLFKEGYDKIISPRGERLLRKINLPEKYLALLINKFENLDAILSADADFLDIFENKEIFNSFNKKLSKLREKIIMGKEFN